MTLLCMSIALLCGTPDTNDRLAADYAFFSQTTVAVHDNSFHHTLPCVGRLSDGRLLLVWSRYAPNSSDFGVVGAFSADGGCSWSPPQVLLDNPGLLDADANIVVVGQRVLVTCTTVDFSQGIRTSATWCVRSEDQRQDVVRPLRDPDGPQVHVREMSARCSAQVGHGAHGFLVGRHLRTGPGSSVGR